MIKVIATIQTIFHSGIFGKCLTPTGGAASYRCNLLCRLDRWEGRALCPDMRGSDSPSRILAAVLGAPLGSQGSIHVIIALRECLTIACLI